MTNLIDCLDRDIVISSENEEIKETKESKPPPFSETENGNTAFGWHHDRVPNNERGIREQIVQFYFQVTLPKSLPCEQLQRRYHDLLNYTYEYQANPVYFDVLVRMAMQTRDIEKGKGIWKFGYYMLHVLCVIWFEHGWINEERLVSIIWKWVYEWSEPGENQQTQMPYGSWKDLKYFCKHLLMDTTYNPYVNKQLYNWIINEFYVKQMVKDRKNMSIRQPVSLCGKWLPRESSAQFKSLARDIARNYYRYVFGNNSPKGQGFLIHYRNLASKLNAYLDTTQIHMCARQWDVINFDHVTSQTMIKNRPAFLNSKNKNEEHRIQCKANLEKHISKKMEAQESMKGKTLLPHQLVAECFKINEHEQHNKCHSDYENDINIINLQWQGLVEHVLKYNSVGENNNNHNNFLMNCIPCIDVSPSMTCDKSVPLFSAIGMGMMAMECSNIKRAFTFSTNPKWLRLDKNADFYKNVRLISKSEWGSTTNIMNLFDKFLDVLIQNKVPEEEVSKYSLMIFSDMQFDNIEGAEGEVELMRKIQSHFLKRGGYHTIPYLIFWNLRSTGNFPTIEKSSNSTKLSGNSASLFRFFLDTDLNAIKQMTNWTLIREILMDPRYNF